MLRQETEMKKGTEAALGMEGESLSVDMGCTKGLGKPCGVVKGTGSSLDLKCGRKPRFGSESCFFFFFNYLV